MDWLSYGWGGYGEAGVKSPRGACTAEGQWCFLLRSRRKKKQVWTEIQECGFDQRRRREIIFREVGLALDRKRGSSAQGALPR